MFMNQRIGKYSFYFEDLNSGYVYAYNENVVMTAAGCIKIPIAMALLREVERSNINLNQKIEIHIDDKSYGKGIIHEFGERDYSLNELMIAMLVQSDNTAANKIIRIIGMDKINECFCEMGLKNTLLRKNTVDESTEDKIYKNVSSSEDLSKCWKHLYNATFLNRDDSDNMISILKRQQSKNKIAFYLPDKIKKDLASKTGDLEGVENDSVLLTTSKGDFVLTIMSDNLPNNIYGNVTITRVGKMIWDIIATNWSYSSVKVIHL